MASVLVLSCYAALRVAFRARDTALAAVGPARAGETALDIIRRDIESAMPPTGRLSGTFVGDQGTEVTDTSTVMFNAVAAPAPGFVEAAAGGTSGMGGGAMTVRGGSGGSTGSMSNLDPTMAGGIVRVAYLVRQSPSGSRVLVRQVQRNLLAQVESGEPDEEAVICRNVRSFFLRYYDGQQMLQAWDSTQLNNALPMAVEVTLELDRPPAPGTESTATVSVASTDQRPYYAAVRTFFPACYDVAAATAAATGDTSGTTGGGQ